MYFLICITTVLANYNTQYVTDQLKIEHNNLDAQKTYLIQMIITQFPVDNYCLPLMQIYNGTQNQFDSQSYSIRSNIQSVLVKQTKKLSIEISCPVLDPFINIKDINKTMHFNLTINEAQVLKQQKSCPFPYYGLDCLLQMQKIQTDYSITLHVLNNTWFYAYVILDNQDYDIKIQNQHALFGISSLPADKLDITILPTFFTNFEILEQTSDEKSISLTRETEISDFIFIFGLFNFNSTHIQEIQISFVSLGETNNFPYWATILLSSIFLFGILVALLIFLSYKSQYRKITQIQPALDRKIFKKYMPTQRINSNLVQETCAVCLIQFERKEKYRETPCKHNFHDQCLSDWTIKQANCPVCRQSLQEQDIQKLLLCQTQLPKLNLEINEKAELKEGEQQQSDRGALYIPFYPTPYRTTCRIDLDNSPQGDNSPQTVQFDGTPNHQSQRDLCKQNDRIVEL
ncbi:unnamed protein product (macronuclear) [Paramecium tetraurelia]|uniref:RING-type domain-containing protein n=1 Tax=Paramecium tetraurelia TaxID=5888 RepID=A0DRP8_PARTE|nr:uncharacterized protein GSPATT00019433001 [Paramecium tetraurelia]CAK85715.1 unnamed protein product [Paramecium tetraurelia]|eukprot:XP_001453112.1 hypothetical protein (macronuclear) [Paramecium tetraurelia strain d4-2]